MLGASPENTSAAIEAVKRYPNGLQIGGGITDENCKYFLEAGASHVIVTSFVFHKGVVDLDRLRRLVAAAGGKHRVVLDLSCRRKKDEADRQFYVVTDRWQTYTDVVVDEKTLVNLSEFCDEFLVHGVDVEGLRCGVDEDLVTLLGQYSPIACTYAGGVRGMQDLELVRRLGRNRVDVTVGSALDIFGGSLSYHACVEWNKTAETSSTTTAKTRTAATTTEMKE